MKTILFLSILSMSVFSEPVTPTGTSCTFFDCTRFALEFCTMNPSSQQPSEVRFVSATRTDTGMECRAVCTAPGMVGVATCLDCSDEADYEPCGRCFAGPVMPGDCSGFGGPDDDQQAR